MQKPLKIAVLDLYNNVPNEGMRCILKLIDEFKEKEEIEIEVSIFNVRAKNKIPDLKSMSEKVWELMLLRRCSVFASVIFGCCSPLSA